MIKLQHILYDNFTNIFSCEKNVKKIFYIKKNYGTFDVTKKIKY